VNETKISNMFCKYKSSHEEAVTAEGVEALCKDLELRPEEFRVLVLAWKCRAERMCRLTRPEFSRGCRALRADSVRGLRISLAEVAAEVLADAEQFKDLYRFTYGFGLDVGQKVLPADMAVGLWQLVFDPVLSPNGAPALLPRWLAFLREHPEVRGVPRDTWNMFLNLTEAVGDDLSAYDDTEAWPSLFDDFVEYENDRQNQNVKR